MPVSERLNYSLSLIPGREISGSEKSSGHILGSILNEENLIFESCFVLWDKCKKVVMLP